MHDENLSAEIDKLLTPIVEEDLISGYILETKKNSKILFVKGHGMVNPVYGTDAITEFQFKIDSIPRLIPAYGIMELMATNLLSLDDTSNVIIFINRTKND